MCLLVLAVLHWTSSLSPETGNGQQLFLLNFQLDTCWETAAAEKWNSIPAAAALEEKGNLKTRSIETEAKEMKEEWKPPLIRLNPMRMWEKVSNWGRYQRNSHNGMIKWGESRTGKG